MKEILQNPELIVAGMEDADSGNDGLLLEEIALVESELKKIQEDDERAVRLQVTGRITEEEIDREREPIKQRLEATTKKLDEYKIRQAAGAYHEDLSNTVTAWAEKANRGLSTLSEEQRKEVLALVLEEVVVRTDNRVVITLAIPFDESMSFASEIAMAQYMI